MHEEKPPVLLRLMYELLFKKTVFQFAHLLISLMDNNQILKVNDSRGPKSQDYKNNGKKHIPFLEPQRLAAKPHENKIT